MPFVTKECQRASVAEKEGKKKKGGHLPTHLHSRGGEGYSLYETHVNRAIRESARTMGEKGRALLPSLCAGEE